MNKLSTTAGDLGDALVGYSGPEIEYRGWIIRGHISGYTATGPKGQIASGKTLFETKRAINDVIGAALDEALQRALDDMRDECRNRVYLPAPKRTGLDDDRGWTR